MRVVHVRHMLVGVTQRRVLVKMSMRLTLGIKRGVGMSMMRVVNMRMGMRHR